MKQAIIVTDPKWLPYDKARAAFKSAVGNVAFVVRGNCKEIKTTAKATKKKLGLVATLLAFTLTVSAQQDIRSLLGATELVNATTNSTANGKIGWSIDQTAVIQLSLLSTNGTSHPTTAVTVYFQTSDNGTDWITDSYSVACIPTATTTASSITRLTNSVGGKYLRVGRIGNPTTNVVTIPRFTISTKQ